MTWQEKLQTGREGQRSDPTGFTGRLPPVRAVLTFAGAALADEAHHQRGAAVALGGRVEGLHHELMCFGLGGGGRHSSFENTTADLRGADGN